MSWRRLPFVILPLLLLILFISAAHAGSADAGRIEKMYLHYTGGAYNVGTVSTGGLIFNTTAVPTNNLGGTSPVWTFYYSLDLPGSLNLSGPVYAYLWLSSNVPASYNWSTSLSWTNSDGVNLGTPSTGGGTITVGTSPALYVLTMASITPPVSVGAGDLLKFVVSFSQTPSTSDVITLYMTTYLSYFMFTLGSPPVTVGTPRFGTAAAVGGEAASFQVEVNDSLGVYDLRQVYAAVTEPGGYTYQANMSPTSPVNPSAYTVVEQGVAADLVGGMYYVVPYAVDNSGNLYAGSSGYFTVVGAVVGTAVWGLLLGAALLFTVLSFVLPVGIGGRAVQIGQLALLVRSAVFPILAAGLWVILAVYSSTLGVFLATPLIYLFYGIGLFMFAATFGFVVYTVREAVRSAQEEV